MKKLFRLTDVPLNELKYYTKRNGFMSPYIICLAAAENRLEYCDFLSDAEAGDCRNNIRTWHQFYRSAILSGGATPDLIQYCRSEFKKTQEQKAKKDPNEPDDPGIAMTTDECRQYIEGFIRKTPLGNCSESKFCMAVTTRDASLCGDEAEGCTQNFLYLDAMENNDISRCEQIRDENLKMLCKAGLATSSEECKKCKSFDNFFEALVDDRAKRLTALPPELSQKAGAGEGDVE